MMKQNIIISELLNTLVISGIVIHPKVRFHVIAILMARLYMNTNTKWRYKLE